MKNSLLKKMTAFVAAGALMVGTLAGCGGSGSDGQTQGAADGGSAQTQGAADQGSDDAQASGEAKGTIMWLSNLTSGPQYDACMAMAEDFCAQMGYKFTVVYGDSFNDPSGNLNAVKNGMTKDVTAIIASQDGGIQNIMDEYPDLYVAGYNTDLAAVYSEGGTATAVKDYEKFLGCICDGFVSGIDTGKTYFDLVLEKGYKKVSVVTFPSFAYPQLGIACEEFNRLVDEYNAAASDSDKIEVVGETKVLEFAPLDESYFLEDGYGDLDAIIGVLAGGMFVYPAMKSAMANGTCSPDTKLLTSGFENDEAMLADIGGDGVIQALTFSPCENMYYAFVLIDNAINGTTYADMDKSVPVDSIRYQIKSKEDIDNVMSKSLLGTLNAADAQISMDDLKQVMTRFNPDATYADLLNLMSSDQLTVEALKNR